MSRKLCRTHVWLTCYASNVLVLAAAGCNSSAELSSPTAQRLRVLVNAYLDYAVAKGAGPANREVLVAHLQNAPTFLLHADDAKAQPREALLTSERDGEPFVIRYGLGIACGSEADVIACEQQGIDGMRLAAYSNGRVAWIDNVAARELMQDQTRSTVAEQPAQASVLGSIQHARR